MGAGEHPIPVALGGVWRINRVCNDCDSRFGHTFDADLIRHAHIETRRHDLQLRGNSGKVPDPWASAYARPVEVIGEPQRRLMLTKSRNGNITAQHIPHVDFRVDVDERGNVRVELPRDGLIIDGKMPPDEAQALIAKRLRQALDAAGVSRDEATIAAAVREVMAQIAVLHVDTTVRLERVVKGRPILPSMTKIAYEAAWYWLGDAWLDDPCALELRKMLAYDDTAIVTGSDVRPEREVDLAGRNPHSSHVICIGKMDDKDGEALVVEVRLFDLLYWSVIVTRTPDRYVVDPGRQMMITDTTHGALIECPLKYIDADGHSGPSTEPWRA
jgi:hypothetical protein